MLCVLLCVMLSLYWTLRLVIATDRGVNNTLGSVSTQEEGMLLISCYDR